MELANQLCRAFQTPAFYLRFARVILHTSLFVARTHNISCQCPNLKTQMCKHIVWSRVRGPWCRHVVQSSCFRGDSKVLFFFFFFAMECASICRVGSFPTPFSRACVVCGFCNIVIYLSLRRSWMFTVRVTSHLNAMGLCFVCTSKLCSSRGCWHRGRLFRFYRVVWWRPSCFVILTMGCLVVTEPFDLTSLVEDTRSPFQIGCKLFLAASVSQHGWAHS